jgi:hypothetical protein
MNEAGRALLAQRILPGSWYPLDAASQIMIALTRALGNDNLSVGMEFIAADLAERDLRGVYQHLITAGDVARSLRRSSILWHNYFDQGTLTIWLPDPKTHLAVARLEGFDQTIPYCCGIPGMARVVVRIAGEGRTCDVKQMHCTLKGDSVCEFHYQWAPT